MNPRTDIVALSLFAAMTVGCYASWDIEPGRVVRLNGFRAGEHRFVVSGKRAEGQEKVAFTRESRLEFRPFDGETTAASFRQIDVIGPYFRGLADGEEGYVRTIDLREMEVIAVKNPVEGSAVTIVTTVLVGSALVVGVVVLLGQSIESSRSE